MHRFLLNMPPELMSPAKNSMGNYCSSFKSNPSKLEKRSKTHRQNIARHSSLAAALAV